MKRKNNKTSPRLPLILATVAIFALAPIVYFTFKNAKQAKAAWWNGDYKYRTAYTYTAALTNSSGTSVRKIKIDVDTASLITAGKMQSDCDDLRIVDPTGKLLDYFIDSSVADCNNASTDVYIVNPDLTTTAKSFYVYLYYGNANVTRSEIGGRKNAFFDQTTLGDGLQGYWKMDETSANNCPGGSGNDDNCNSAYSTEIGNLNPATGSVTGKITNAYSLNGANEGTTGDTFDMGTSDWSMSFWVKTSGTDGHIVGKNKGTNTSGNYSVSLSSGSLIATINYGSGNVSTTGVNGVNDDNWHNIIVNFDRDGNLDLFVDGLPKASTSISAGSAVNMNHNCEFSVGAAEDSACSADAATYYTGYLDDLRLYNRLLTSKEITTIQQAQEIPTYVNGTISSGPTAASEETTPGPIAYWKFDEGQGQSVFDGTKHANSGTLGANSSSASDDPTWKQESDCVSGKCLYFDGTNDYVNTTDINSIKSATTFTIEAWVKTNSRTDYDGVINKRSSDTDRIGMSVGGAAVGNNDDVLLLLANGSSTAAYTTGNILTDNKWNHWVMVYNGNGSTNSDKLKFYFNGIQQTLTFSGTIPSSTSSTAGNLQLGLEFASRFLNGFIDEPKIYPYARSASEVRNDYQQGAQAVLGATNQKFLSDGLVGYWKMDESSGAGTTVADSSGNGNTLTSNSSTNWGSGKFGNSLYFGDVPTSNNYAVKTDTTGSVLDVSTITMSSWIYLTGNPTQDYTVLLFKNGAYSLQMRSNKTIWTQYPTSCIVGTSDAFSLNTWYHVAATYDLKNVNIYINGAMVKSCPYTTAMTQNNSDIDVSFNSASYSWPGKIDELRIYNRALSADEVRNLYNWAPGPVGYWNFDEGSGTSANDLSGNANTGTITNATYTKQGKYGNALSFDGSGDYVTRADDSDFDFAASDGFTVGGWFKHNTASAAQYIFTKSQAGTNGGYKIYMASDGDIVFDIDDDSTWTPDDTVTTTAATYDDNAWHYFTAVKNGTTGIYIYIDGVLIASDTSIAATGTLANDDPIYIGIDDDGSSNAWNGQLDDIKVYNYARTAGQIVEDMNGTHPLGGSPVGSQLAYWNFDEQQGQTVHDKSINNTTGTLGTDSSSASDDPTWKTNADCKVNGCLLFDGGDFVNTTLTPPLGANARTITAWAKFSNVSNTERIFAYGETAASCTTGEIFSFGIQSGVWIFNGCGGSFDVSATSGPVVGRWYHVTLIYTGTRVQAYVDGNKVIDSALALSTGNTSLQIGRLYPTDPKYMQGNIDEVKVYNSALTIDQIRADMNNGSAVSYSVLGASESASLADGPGNPPVAEWQMNDSTGQNVVDTSGNSNTGILGVDSSSASDDPTWAYVTKQLTLGNDIGGSALTFDGSNDYVSVANTIAGVKSVSFWVNPATTTQSLLALSGTVYLTASSGTITATGFTSPTIYVNGKPSGTLTANVWQHVEVTTATGVSASAVTLGKANSAFLNGKLDAVKLYDYTRTQGQVAYDFNRGKPIGWWKMDECQGSTAYDASGFGNNGTVTIGATGTQASAGNCITSSTAWYNGATGKYSSSLNFDGTDDYVSLGNPSTLDLSNEITVSLWFKGPTQSGLNEKGLVFGGPTSGTIERRYFMKALTTTQVSWQIRNASIGDSLILTTTYTPNTWTHIVGTAKQSGANIVLQLYKDGIYIGTISQAGTWSSISYQGAWIGNWFPNSRYFEGQIDDVRIYNYVLSANQVKKVFNEGSAVRYGN